MGQRSTGELVRETFELYRRYPVLFFVLASAVVVPYDTLALVFTGTGPFERGSLSFGVSSLLTTVGLIVIDPLVSALHVHAVKVVSEGEEPRLASIAREGLKVLPVVAAATIMSWLGIFAGFLLLIVPGVILWLRWMVVAQAAAIEDEGWIPALRRSRALTAGHYRHVFAVVLLLGLIGGIPTVLVGLAFSKETTTAPAFLVGLLLNVLTMSFTALGMGLLYFDLVARLKGKAASVPGEEPAGSLSEGEPAVEHSIDPAAYEDHERPPGWYIDPSAPGRMRYWGAGGTQAWGASTKTPRKIRQEWQSRSSR